MKFVIFLFVLSSFIGVDNVHAQELTKNFCLNNGIYTITWDTESNVNEDLIVKNSNSVINSGYIGEETDNNKVLSITNLNLSCMCSSSDGCKQGEYNTCNNNAGEYTDFKDYVVLEFDKGTGKYSFYLKDSYTKRDKLKMRIIKKGTSYENIDQVNLYGLNNNVATIMNANGVFTSYPNNEGYHVEFYLNDGSDCRNTYVGFYEFSASPEVLVDNPAISNPSYYGCDVVKNYANVTESYKAAYIPECYSSTISYSKIGNLRNTINSSFNELKQIAVNVKPVANWGGGSSVKCDYNINNNKYSNSTTFNMADGEYWYANCSETVTVIYNEPQYVNAGGGFEYGARYTVTRTCTPILKKKIEKLTQCNYDVSCEGGRYNQEVGQHDAGPTEDFDDCVYACDGGKYTQGCINSCYNNVYSYSDIESNYVVFKNNLILTDKSKNNNISFVSAPLLEYTGWQMVGFDSKYCSYQTSSYVLRNCVSPHGVAFRYSTRCQNGDDKNNPTICKEYVTNGPVNTNCYEDAETVYKQHVIASKNEYQNLINAISSYAGSNEVFTYQITDSYLTTINGSNYVYEVTNKGNPVVVTNYSYSSPSYSNSSNYQISDYGDYLNTSRITVSKTIDVSLPKAYLEKNSGVSTYATVFGNNNIVGHTVNNVQNKFNASTKLDVNNYYDGGNKYYTSVYSDSVNSKDAWGSQGFTPDYNIKLIGSSIGTNRNLTVNVSCFYGVKNNYIKSDNECNGDPYCKGMQYIFRPVDLTNLFPDREPRWNWSNAAKASGGKYIYNIDPTLLISEIEEKGNNVFTDKELDYDIILTRSNINAIRKYNKRNNYLVFDMECGANNTSCKSNFLDNGNFIKNAGSVRVNATIGTNND